MNSVHKSPTIKQDHLVTRRWQQKWGKSFFKLKHESRTERESARRAHTILKYLPTPWFMKDWNSFRDVNPSAFDSFRLTCVEHTNLGGPSAFFMLALELAELKLRERGGSAFGKCDDEEEEEEEGEEDDEDGGRETPASRNPVSDDESTACGCCNGESLLVSIGVLVLLLLPELPLLIEEVAVMSAAVVDGDECLFS